MYSFLHTENSGRVLLTSPPSVEIAGVIIMTDNFCIALFSVYTIITDHNFRIALFSVCTIMTDKLCIALFSVYTIMTDTFCTALFSGVHNNNR